MLALALALALANTTNQCCKKKQGLTVVKHSVVVRRDLDQGEFLLSNVGHAILSPEGEK